MLKNRNNQIDSLRGIAIIAIFIMHAYLYSKGIESIGSIMMLGSFGVQFGNNFINKIVIIDETNPSII